MKNRFVGIGAPIMAAMFAVSVIIISCGSGEPKDIDDNFNIDGIGSGTESFLKKCYGLGDRNGEPGKPSNQNDPECDEFYATRNPGDPEPPPPPPPPSSSSDSPEPPPPPPASSSSLYQPPAQSSSSLYQPPAQSSSSRPSSSSVTPSSSSRPSSSSVTPSSSSRPSSSSVTPSSSSTSPSGGGTLNFTDANCKAVGIGSYTINVNVATNDWGALRNNFVCKHTEGNCTQYDGSEKTVVGKYDNGKDIELPRYCAPFDMYPKGTAETNTANGKTFQITASNVMCGFCN